MSQVPLKHIKKVNVFFGLFSIFVGIHFLLNPVFYGSGIAYDLRGPTKWVASFIALLTGLFFLFSAVGKGRLVKQYCPECGKIEKLPEKNEYQCRVCDCKMVFLSNKTDS